jgi:hypothetical protein
MHKDILPVMSDPWHKVINDPVLVPSPLLAAFSALPAILGHGMILSHKHRLERDMVVISMAGDERWEQKKRVLLRRNMTEPVCRLPRSCEKPAAGPGF